MLIVQKLPGIRLFIFDYDEYGDVEDVSCDDTCSSQVVVLQDQLQNSTHIVSNDMLHHYDQHICDQTIEPEVSSSMALLREFGITVLLKLLAAKEWLTANYGYTKEKIATLLELIYT